MESLDILKEFISVVKYVVNDVYKINIDAIKKAFDYTIDPNLYIIDKGAVESVLNSENGKLIYPIHDMLFALIETDTKMKNKIIAIFSNISNYLRDRETFTREFAESMLANKSNYITRDVYSLAITVYMLHIITKDI